MHRTDAEILYTGARYRHIKRRDHALRSVRRAITRPGWCEHPAGEQIRAWFDKWETHLWETYQRERDANSGAGWRGASSL